MCAVKRKAKRPRLPESKTAGFAFLASIERETMAKARQLMQFSALTPQLKRLGLASQHEVQALQERVEALEKALIRYAAGDKAPPLSARQTFGPFENDEHPNTLPRG